MLQIHRLISRTPLSRLSRSALDRIQLANPPTAPPRRSVTKTPTADSIDLLDSASYSSSEPTQLTTTLSRMMSSASSSSNNNNPPNPSISSQQATKTNDQIPTSYGNFDRVIEPFHLDSAPIQVTKWKSRETGLTVVWADVEGPLINGYFTVATEIFNDSGIPHTLEHLIFLGSEQYPYKGILDSLANRAFARGTNAWTDTTHTAYTVTTAGSDGFLRFLPIYLDHVLYPTITDEGFTTEVFHINGKGEEAGVVFSEMQARENTSYDLMALRNKQLLFPPTSAYRSETGGLMEALRVLTVEQIRQYHSSYYQPHNLQLVISGRLNPTELLEVLNSKVEPILIKHGQNKLPEGWKRPFLETPSKGGAQLEKDQTVEVEFPEKDESIGEVQISWVGPNFNDALLQTALEVLFTYLSDSAVSPLAQKFIEIDSPLCTYISFQPTDAEKTVLTICLSSVPSEHLSSIGDLVKKALSEEASKLDTSRLKMVIERSALQTADQMEVDAHDSLSAMIISNFLYGTDSDLVSDFKTGLKRYKVLAGWTEDQWSRLFKTWLVDQPSVCLIGKPSAKLSEKLESDTAQRIKDTRSRYGPDGLKELADKLARAQKINDRPYPDKLIEGFPIPTLDSIHWIDVDIADSIKSCNAKLQAHVDSKDPATLPYFVQFNHIKSNFVTIHVNLSPPNLPVEFFPLLPTYIGSFFSLPLKRKDGTQLSYEEVVHKLDQQTIGYGIQLGSPISQTLEISIKVEKSKYNDAISWLRDLLYGSIFDIDRLRISTTKSIQSIPSSKREGSAISSEVYNQLIYDSRRSPMTSTTLFQQEINLPLVLEKAKSEPEALINQMEKLRSHLLQPSSMRISVSGDIYSLEEPKSSWLKHFETVKPEKLQKPLFGNAVLTPAGMNPSGRVDLVSMPFIESSYAYHVAKGPQGFDHPDQATLTIAMSVLNALESYLWKAIRGPGLAYSASISCDFEVGLVYLNIYSSPDSSEAFFEAGRVIKDLIDKKLDFDNVILESAKSSSVFSIANKIATGPDAAHRAFVDVALKGVSKDALRQQLAKAKSVTVEDVLKMIEKYMLPIFDPKSSIAAIASTSNKSHEIAQKLKSKGYQVDVKELQSNNSSSLSGNDEDDLHSDASSSSAHS